MLNRVILVGRLTRDPEVRTTNSGKNVANFSIAVDRRIKTSDGQTADFFRVSAWGQTADFVGNYLNKGRLVAVEGRLSSRKYTDSAGANREAVEVVADSVQGLDRPRDGDTGAGGAAAADAGPRSAEPADDEYDPFADE